MVFSGDFGPEGGFQHKPDFWPTGIDSTTIQKTTPTCKTFVQQQQQQQQEQEQEQEQEQSQVTESKRHRTKTMKNQYLSGGSGGSGQGCSDSSKNTQPQFVFSGDFGPEGGGPT